PQDLLESEKHLGLSASSPACAATRHYGLGLLALRRRQPAEAARELKEAARLDPRPDVTFQKLAVAERMLGHTSAAAKALGEYHTRHSELLAEAEALRAVGSHPEEPKEYARAAGVFESFGRQADA